MPYVLTTPFTVPNGTRVSLRVKHFNESIAEMSIEVALLTPPATNYRIANVTIAVRNGRCGRVSIVAPPSGADVSQCLQVAQDALNVPAGYDGAFEAWRGGGATAGARENALRTYLLSVGILHTSLAGS